MCPRGAHATQEEREAKKARNNTCMPPPHYTCALASLITLPSHSLWCEQLVEWWEGGGSSPWVGKGFACGTWEKRGEGGTWGALVLWCHACYA